MSSLKYLRSLLAQQADDDLLDQLPEEKLDVYNQLYGDEEPDDDHVYDAEPPGQVTLALEKTKYTHDTAVVRAKELFTLRGLKPLKKFQTARCYVWTCAKV